MSKLEGTNDSLSIEAYVTPALSSLLPVFIAIADTVVALHHLQGEDLHLHVVARVHGLVLVVLHEDVDIVVQVQAVLVNWSGVIEQSSFTSHHVRILLDKVGTSLNEHSALLLLEMFYTDFLYSHVAHDTLKLYGKMCGLSYGRTGQ